MMGSYRAIKVVYRDSFESIRPYERELNGLQKFEPVSRGHPNLVNILHVGENREQGYFYCIMEVADPMGCQAIAPESYQPHTLATDLKQRGRLPFPEALSLGISLCSALEYLHARGLIHRDIKPANIIYAQGQPKLADIGLVTSIGTQGTRLGTEGYIPPEGPGTPGADLYSLGRVLYQASMGMSQDEFPELPERLGDWPDRPDLMRLNGVVLQACAQRPGKRFQTAGEMLAELRRLGQGTRNPESPAEPASPRTGTRVLLVPDSDAPEVLAVLRSLSQGLSANGYQTSVEVPKMLTLEWARSMEHQVRSAPAIVLLFSNTPSFREEVVYILQLASRAGRTAPGASIIPLSFGPAENLPAALGSLLKPLATQAIAAEDAPAKTIEHVLARLSHSPRL
jgi:serine/threonine protein kinase